jgi:hypothetical protein
MQTEFGFDEDFDVDIPYRNRPAAHRHGISLGSSGKNSAQDPRQAPITQYFEKQSMSTSTSALRGIPVSTSHSSATARDDTADEVDSDDELENLDNDFQMLNQKFNDLKTNTKTNQSFDVLASLQEPLNSANKEWKRLQNSIMERKSNLQNALLDMGQFNEALDEMLKWLDSTDQSLDEINLNPFLSELNTKSPLILESPKNISNFLFISFHFNSISEYFCILLQIVFSTPFKSSVLSTFS